MHYDEFRALVESLNDQGEFTFGTNWYDYVKKTLSEPIINQHVSDLGSVLSQAGVDISDRSVFDIGCGSGLSSLAFTRLGAKSVYGIDIDPKSIAATQLTKEKFGDPTVPWQAEEKSILDDAFDQYGLVYSWGVLHHTGHMWRAIDIAKRSVAVDGYFYVALYRSGPTFPYHLAQKQQFASLDREGKLRALYQYTGGNAEMFVTDNRGMNRFHDAIDWLGGLPYEVCDPAQLDSFLPGFERKYFRDGNEGGNFVVVYHRVK
jgi:2-polyprenyl-6-hydroxyphenyl methylase/3-demethylubiquinone-9 3-methyltransferase